MSEEDSIAITIIKANIERCEATISKHKDPEDVGVRIAARGKIIMLESIIKDIIYTSKRLE
jgi:hypothetical protein